MSLDPQFLESGRYNNERNPLAFQISYAGYPDGVDMENGVITNPNEVIQALMGIVEALTRSVAVLEDQISELRGSRALPKDTLIHVAHEPGDEPAPNPLDGEITWADSAVIDPTIDS